MTQIFNFFLFFWSCWPCRTELIVNVSRNKTHPEAGALKQIISGNASTELVTIEFQEVDGTLVTILTDFRTSAQVTRLIIPGEEELNEPRAQTLCFVSAFSNDLISPEAVMKLRQKHPGAIRVADEDMGEVVQDSPIRLHAKLHMPGLVSSHLSKMCRESLSSEHELFNILNNAKLAKMAPALAKAKDDNYENLQRCYNQDYSDLAQPCLCSRQVWMVWYPCALKYCRNQQGEGEHRCGIKTCQKCLTFRFKAKSKLHCTWDEP